MRKAGEYMRQRYDSTHRVSSWENKRKKTVDYKKGVQEDEQRLIKRQEKEQAWGETKQQQPRGRRHHASSTNVCPSICSRQLTTPPPAIHSPPLVPYQLQASWR